MSKFVVADMEYGPEEIRTLVKRLVDLRNNTLKQKYFDWSIVLTHTIGLLNLLAEELEQ